MKLLQQNEGLLTNAEVLSVLRDRGCEASIAGASASRPLASCEKILLQHLSEQPRPDMQQILGFMKAVLPFDLTRAEILQLINLVPTSAVEIHLIVESCEERLSGERVEELLGLIAQQLRPCKVPDKT